MKGFSFAFRIIRRNNWVTERGGPKGDWKLKNQAGTFGSLVSQGPNYATKGIYN